MSGFKGLLLEGIVVGIIFLLVSIPVMNLTRCYFKDVGVEKYYVATVISGLLGHLLFEAVGLNSAYCKYKVSQLQC